jgi:RNA recognition motif-containing protein
MNTKIYITNMKGTTDERELSEIFMRFGEIVSIVHKGSYAFIEYAETGCAEEAIKEMSQSKSELKVQMAYTKSSAQYA